MAASSALCTTRWLSGGLPGLRGTFALLKSSRQGDIGALRICWTRSYVTGGNLSCWRHRGCVTLKGVPGELIKAVTMNLWNKLVILHKYISSNISHFSGHICPFTSVVLEKLKEMMQLTDIIANISVLTKMYDGNNIVPNVKVW